MSSRQRDVVRIAAMGDVHCRRDHRGELRRLFTTVSEHADVLLLCGDLIDHGDPEEAKLLASEIEAGLTVPAIAVLGNHDYEGGHDSAVTEALERVGVHVLDGDAVEVQGIGFAGVKGFGGGFGQGTLGPWGEPAIKAFVAEAVHEASKLDQALASLDTPQKVALLHYSPILDTVLGEDAAIHPFLGSGHLEGPLDRHKVRAAFHGHAHSGRMHGRTTGGTPVYNVAIPLLRRLSPELPPFHVLELSRDASDRPWPPPEPRDGSEEGRVYSRALDALAAHEIPCLVGGGWAMSHFAGTHRQTHDLDLMIRPVDRDRALAVLAQVGFETFRAHPHWLAKALWGPYVIDVIYNSGNGAVPVDALWFRHAEKVELWGRTASLCPAEELLWSKAYIMERERFDGADVLHLIRSCGDRLDWDRILWRFTPHPELLLAHLMLFDFVYPSERLRVPEHVLPALWRATRKLRGEFDGRPLCRGTLLSRAQYRRDVADLGYADARIPPEGTMSEQDVREWTERIPPEVG